MTYLNTYDSNGLDTTKKLVIIAMPILLALAADPIFFHNREPFFS